MFEWIQVLPKIVNMTIAASCAGGVVLLLRAVLKKVPAGYFYALWLMVFLRFLCPVSLESAVSLIPVGQDAVTYKSIVSAGIHAYAGVSGVLPADSVIRRIPAAAGAKGIDSISLLLGVCMILWLSGLLIFLGTALHSFYRLKRRVAEAVLLKPKDKGRPAVYESAQIVSPFLMGFLQPVVYLPKGMTEIEIQHVLAHEYEHFRRRDYLLKPVCFLAVLIHWFNPLAWLFFRLMTDDMERSCDDRVLKRMSAQDRVGYAQTLLRLGLRNNGLGFLLPAAFGESNTKKRIFHILNFRKPSGWLCSAALLLVIGAGAVLLTSPSGRDQGENTENAVGQTEAGPLAGEELASFLVENRNPYIGDHIQDSVLLGALPVPENLEYQRMQLQTTQEPYELTVVYRTAEEGGFTEKDWSFSNAVLLFATIDNAGKITFAAGEQEPEYQITYDRRRMEEEFGSLYQYSSDKGKLIQLQKLIASYLEAGIPDGFYEEQTVQAKSQGNAAEEETAGILPNTVTEDKTEENGAVMIEKDKESYPAKNAKVSITVKNLSEGEITFGDFYELYKEVNGSYQSVQVKENVGWNDILNYIPARETGMYILDLNAVFGDLEPGEYRVQKTFDLETGEKGMGDSEIRIFIPITLD